MALSVMTDDIERSHTLPVATAKRGKKTRRSWRNSKHAVMKKYPSDPEIDEQFDNVDEGGSLAVIARSAATKQSRVSRGVLDCFASLAMTVYSSTCRIRSA